MTNPISLQSKSGKSNTGKLFAAHPKKPVEAVCQPVKEAVTRELSCHSVKSANNYLRVGQAVAKKIDSSIETVPNPSVEEEVAKAHIQIKETKDITYKQGSKELTLDELFMIQNGEEHG